MKHLVVLPEGEGASRFRDGDVDVCIVPLGRVRAKKSLSVQIATAYRLPLDLVAIHHVFRRFRPDVVQLSSLMNPHAAYVAKMMGIPIVWQLVDTRPPLPLRRAMMKQVGFLADVIMPIGHQVAAAHPGSERFGERSIVFSPPVDLTEFMPGPSYLTKCDVTGNPNAPLILVVGNVNPQKGHETFIRAAGLVQRAIPDAHFAVAGHIYPNHLEYLDFLIKTAKENGLHVDGNLHFLGARRDISDLMSAADVFALASVPNSEGLPTVILEAMASGLPVVATDVGSVSEAIDNGRTGFVVKPHNHVEMADRIISLLSAPEMRYRFSIMARSIAEERYSLDSYLEAHLAAYDMAVRHARRHGRPSTP